MGDLERDYPPSVALLCSSAELGGSIRQVANVLTLSSMLNHGLPESRGHPVRQTMRKLKAG
jgi:hypothetical protein